jgi:hypothetical protein
LGNRYLLVEPVRRRSDEFKGYYVEPRRWHAAVRRSGRPSARGNGATFSR